MQKLRICKLHRNAWIDIWSSKWFTSNSTCREIYERNKLVRLQLSSSCLFELKTGNRKTDKSRRHFFAEKENVGSGMENRDEREGKFLAREGDWELNRKRIKIFNPNRKNFFFLKKGQNFKTRKKYFVGKGNRKPRQYKRDSLKRRKIFGRRRRKGECILTREKLLLKW